ncbi:IS110 family transposase [Mitsuaria sp. WAJ17]|nr:IS110 family transposase [Mitsuaria sp. WAJ17]
MAKEDERARRLMQLGGVGPTAATCLLAMIRNGHDFDCGRQFAAWLGLTPGQYSSGGKTRLGRITKAGGAYLRSLLVLGAKALLAAAKNKTVGSNLDRRQHLVPKQHSSGGKPHLGTITKRGDAYLRTLLIQGAKSVVNTAHTRSDPISRWVLAVYLSRSRRPEWERQVISLGAVIKFAAAAGVPILEVLKAGKCRSRFAGEPEPY